MFIELGGEAKGNSRLADQLAILRAKLAQTLSGLRACDM